jgi:Copper amine oxidase N-terminal domain.
MKKKAVVALVTLLFVSAAFSVAGYAIGKNEVVATLAKHIKITNEGRKIDIGSDAPLLYNNKTYLPVRAVGEALGYEVKWLGESHTVNFSLPDSAYPIISLDGIEIVEVSPSLNLMSATAIQSANVIVELTKEFEHEPILILEVLKGDTVVDSKTAKLEKTPGRYVKEIKSGQFSHSLRDMTADERLEKYNAQYSYRIKIK